MRVLPPERAFLGDENLTAADLAGARVVVIPFGLEATVSYGSGTGEGPRAILEASWQVETFDEELWCEPWREIGIATLEPFEIPAGVEAALDRLEAEVEQVLQAGKFPLVLGGEHSLTPGALRPFARRHEALTVLCVDAHADLREEYQGSLYSHACAMRRCLDLPGVRVVSVGVRSLSAGEARFLEAQRDRVRIFWAHEDWTAQDVLAAVEGPVYLSLDVDGFDSALVPATGTPEPGGLSWRRVLDLLRAVFRERLVLGADLVELASEAHHACSFLAARLAHKVLGYRFLAGRSAPLDRENPPR